MKKWMVFPLAFAFVLLLIYVGLEALANHRTQMGLFFTFVGGMTVVGLVVDVVIHLRSRRWM